jgi:protein TonB
MGDVSRSPTSVARGVILSVALHAPAIVWVGTHILDDDARPQATLYEVEVVRELPRPTPPSRAPEPPTPPPREVLPPPDPGPSSAAPPPARPGGRALAEVSRAPGPPRAPGVPAAAQAGRVLTAPDAEGEPGPLDFTVVEGDADRYAGGVTAARGTAERAVRDPRARGGSSAPPARSGDGGGGAEPPAPPVDRSRPPLPVSGSWDCPFPPAADVDQVHYARVVVIVTVRSDGSAAAVTALSDPGSGFADAARSCALAQRYTPPRDSRGQPTFARTAPITVVFIR